MKPTEWIVSWESLGTVPAGSESFTQRARARGFFMIRRASGFVVTIQAKGF